MSKLITGNGNLCSTSMVLANASSQNNVNVIKSNASMPINSVTVPISISPSTNNAPLQIQPKPVVTIFQQPQPTQSSYNNASNSRLLPAPQTQNTFAIQPNNHFISQQTAPITFTLAPIAAKPPSDLQSTQSAALSGTTTTATTSNTTNFTPIQMRPAISHSVNSASAPKPITQSPIISHNAPHHHLPSSASSSSSLSTPQQPSSSTTLSSNTSIGPGGLTVASNNGFYREWILEAIDKLRERKARPDADRISTLMKRYHNIPLEDTVVCLSKLADSGAVVCVDYKGNISYRNPYKWRKNSANGGGIINPPSITSRLLEAFRCLDRTRQAEGSVPPTAPGTNPKLGYSITEIEQALQRCGGPGASPDLSKLQLRHCLEREANYGKLIRRPDNTYVIDETGEKKARKTTAIQAKKTSITSTAISTIPKTILNKTIAAAPILQQQQNLINAHNLQPAILQQQQSAMMAPAMFTTAAYTTQQLLPTILTTQPAPAVTPSPSPILPKQPTSNQNVNTPNIAFVKYEQQQQHHHQPHFINQHQPLSLVTTQSLVTMPTINNVITQPPPNQNITPTTNEIKAPSLSTPSPQTISTTPISIHNTTTSNSNTIPTPTNNNNVSNTSNSNNNSTKSNRRGRPPGSKNKRIDTVESNNIAAPTITATFTPNNNSQQPTTILNYENNTPAKKLKLEQVVVNPNPSSIAIDGTTCAAESSIISVTNSDQTVPAIGTVIDLCSECKLPQSEFEKFLFCRDCPIKVHPSCLHYWPELTERARQAPWQCSSCKTCSICNDKSSKESVYICDGCDKGYHSNCHSPKIQEPISRNSAWICCNCYNEGFRIRTDESVKKVLANNATQMNTNNDCNGDINADVTMKSGNDEVKIKKENCVDELGDKAFNMNKENNQNPPSSTNRSSNNESLAAVQSSNQPRPADVTKWTVEHVCNWLDAEGFSSQSASFREQEIDGACLLLMKRIDVLTELNIKLGPAVKIYEKIKRIQTENSFFKVEEF